MHYFVTGGTGFIGAYVVRDLVRAGHEVTAFDMAPDREFLSDLLTDRVVSSVRLVAGDVTDLPHVLRSMKEAKAERVIHLAALLGARSEENPYRSLRVNCEGCLNVFEAALACDAQRVVWASSVAVFGPRHRRQESGAIPNDAPHDPAILYGACKSLVERFSAHYRKVRRLDLLGLRFSLVYGYGKDRTVARGTGGDFLTQLIDNPARGLAGRVPAGDAILDLVHVDDAARAVVLASDSSMNKPVAVNVTGFRASLRETAEIVRSIEPDADLVVEDGSWRGTNHHYEAETARDEIGYFPTVPIKDGFARNIREIREYSARKGTG